jgi:P27 family predicted phage terminase small subunit
MGRKPKSIDTATGHKTKAEKAIRKEVQDKLKGEINGFSPAPYLTSKQLKLFKRIAKHLELIEMLGTFDNTILNSYVIAVDRLDEIEKAINEDSNAMLNKNLLTAKDRYTKDFLTGVNHFGFSPLARAKMGTLASQKKEASSDPVLKAIGD